MKFDFITIGGATEDIYMHTDGGLLINTEEYQNIFGLKLDSKVPVKKAGFYFGGGAANAAASFALMGFKTAAVLGVGSDERGRDIIKNLKKKKIDTSCVQIHKDEKSGFSIFLFGPGNEHVLFTYRGANSYLELNEKDIANISRAECIYIASLTGDWKKLLKKICGIKKAKIVWNPGGSQIKAGKKTLLPFFKHTDVLIMNSDEAALLTMPEDDRYQADKISEKIEKMLRLIKRFGPKIAVITDGANGAYAFDGKKTYFQPALRTRYIIDTTGAGDAFGSGFAAGLKIYNNDIPRAMEMAAKNAAMEISKRGPQNKTLSADEIK
jgi:sugar/nucleoside kinase (ribokinase family)